MRFAFELSPRQSARLIERARRQRVSLEVHPRSWDDDRVLGGSLLEEPRDSLCVGLSTPPSADYTTLIGVHCEARFSLNGNRYLFGTTIVDATIDGGPARIDLAYPSQVLVAERRGFWRTPLAQASEVRLTPRTGPDTSCIRATLCNLSPRGLACSVMHGHIDALLIGEPVELAFELPDRDRTFELPGTVCNKTPAGTEDKYIVGIQFTIPHGDGAIQETVEAIKGVLYANLENPF